MKADPLLDRIVINPRVMVGKPIVRGTRLTVEYILNLMAHGATESEILAEYNGLTRADLQACLLFAAQSLQSTLFMPLTMEPA
jgi:uncharacterized protein (DUF433 family)